jgi:hypothetical protein
MIDLKAELLRVLQGSRAVMLAKLDGLSEYDRRRPSTPTGTNLLGLVKHLAGLEYGYLGDPFGRPPVERPSWFRDDPYAEIDMWATPDESSEYITGVYRQGLRSFRHHCCRARPGQPRSCRALGRRPPGDNARSAVDQDGQRDSTARRTRRHHPRTDRRPDRGRRRNRRCGRGVLARQEKQSPTGCRPLPGAEHNLRIHTTRARLVPRRVGVATASANRGMRPDRPHSTSRPEIWGGLLVDSGVLRSQHPSWPVRHRPDLRHAPRVGGSGGWDRQTRRLGLRV